MKKTLAMLLAVLMMLGCLVACAAEPATTTDTPASTDTPATTTPSAPADEPAEKPAETPAATDEPTTDEPTDIATTDEATASLYPLCAPGEITIEWFCGDKTNAVLQLAEADFSQNVFWQYMEELTGIHIEFNILSGDTYAEQFNLMLVSEDYPDMATNTASKCSSSADQAYEDGVLVDLNEYIDLIPNYRSILDTAVGGYKGHLTDNGHLLGFYQLRDRVQPSFLGYYTRGDWMEDLGLSEPETIEDWYNMLVAFRDNKTGGAPPMMMAANGMPIFNWISRAWGICATAPFMVQRDGVVACTAIEDGWRGYLEEMAKWYAEGLIVKDFPSNPDANELLTNNQLGVWSGMFRMGGTYNHDVLGLCDENYYAQKLKHPVLEKGGKNMIGDVGAIQGPAFGDPQGALIFCDNPYIEETISMMDYIYSEEGVLHSNWGWEGVHFEYNEDGKPQYLPWMKDPDQGTNRALYLIHSRPKMDLLDGIEDALPADALDYYEYWNDVGEWNMPTITYTIEEGEERSPIQNNVATYVEEFTVKVIANQIELNDQTWNDYVDALKAMGVDRMTEITQVAFDRFMSR